MDFLTYKGTYSDKKSAMLDVRAGGANAGLEGQGASKLHSSFDNLKKEELDVRKLLSDSSNRFCFDSFDIIFSFMNLEMPLTL